MTILLAYIDSSGRLESHPVAFVAACVAPVEQWERLEPDWNHILEDCGVLPNAAGVRILHMKEFSHGLGAFKRMTAAQRTELSRRTTSLLRSRLSFWTAWGLPKSAYEGACAINPPLSSMHPLTLMGMRCIKETVGRAARMGIAASDIAYIIEKGDPNESELAHVMTRLESNAAFAEWRPRGWSFVRKGMAGLQAADLVAYETFQWGKREVLPQYGEASPTDRPRRRSMEALAHIPNTGICYKDYEELLRDGMGG